MNYYPFHVGDYVSATRHLSWEEDAAFRRLLDTYYVTEKPLPADHRAVCRLVIAQTDGQREAVKIVLQEFFELTDTGWINHRADAEILAMQEKQEIARVKANKRWDKHRAEHSNATAMPQHINGNAVASKLDADAMLPTPTPTPTPTPKHKVKDIALALLADVPEKIVLDWLVVRKDKKAAFTETAVSDIRQEAGKAGLTMEAVLTMCCQRGWAGFKASWDRDGKNSNAQSRVRPQGRQNLSDVNYSEGVTDDGTV